jgi:hypothetical protein
MSTSREGLPTARTYIGTERVLKVTSAECARTVPVDLEALAKSKFGNTPLLYLELRCQFIRSLFGNTDLLGRRKGDARRCACASRGRSDWKRLGVLYY